MAAIIGTMTISLPLFTEIDGKRVELGTIEAPIEINYTHAVG